MCAGTINELIKLVLIGSLLWVGTSSVIAFLNWIKEKCEDRRLAKWQEENPGELVPWYWD